MKNTLILSIFITFLFAKTTLAKDTSYFEICNNQNAHNTTIPFDEEGKFRPECAPDTLYSWQPRSRINWDRFTTDPTFGKGYLFTWRTPLATFGYGDVQIRIKLKPDVKFKRISEYSNDCRAYSPDLWKNTIFVAVFSFGATDYMICSPEVAESWSTRTQESKIEALNELNFIRAHKKGHDVNYDAYGFAAGRKRNSKEYYKNPYFVTADNTKKNWSTKKLKSNLNDMSTVETPSEGKVYFNVGIEPNREKHFLSNSNSYYQLSTQQLKTLIRD